MVNTASLCGYTPQYAGLQALWAEFRDRGLTVIGVPSNDFGSQEPGGATEIVNTAQVHFGVSMVLESSQLDGIFHALADPTRRAMVRALVAGEAEIGDCTRPGTG